MSFKQDQIDGDTALAAIALMMFAGGGSLVGGTVALLILVLL